MGDDLVTIKEAEDILGVEGLGFLVANSSVEPAGVSGGCYLYHLATLERVARKIPTKPIKSEALRQSLGRSTAKKYRNPNKLERALRYLGALEK
jgi:hypothetical protein